MSSEREAEIRERWNPYAYQRPAPHYVHAITTLLAELDRVRPEFYRAARLVEDAERIIEAHSGKGSWIGSSVLRDWRKKGIWP